MLSPSTLADMHIHSHASDSTESPAQIIQRLLDLDIGIASLTDHNDISNVPEFISLAANAGIYAIPGVELNAKEGDTMYHILAYCFDPGMKRIMDYAASILSMMKYSNRELIKAMSVNDGRVDLGEYDSYSYDRSRGGWESINYLYDKGITQTPLDGLQLYTEYGCQPINHPYPGPGEVISEILEWGAYPILAHPSYYLDQNSVSSKEICTMLDRLKEYGIMGVECHYASHNELMTQTTVDWCRNNGMMITAGCDGHGDFIPGKGIGSLRIPLAQLNINKILEAGND